MTIRRVIASLICVVRAGATHQGVVSNAFEKTDGARAMLNPHVIETKAKDGPC